MEVKKQCIREKTLPSYYQVFLQKENLVQNQLVYQNPGLDNG